MGGFVQMTLGFSKTKVVKQHKRRRMSRRGFRLRSGSSWLGRAGGEHRTLQALPKVLSWFCASCGQRGGRRRSGGRLRPHLNAISLKAFFLSSEGAGSRQHNCGLCMMVNSLCLEKSMRKVCLCVQRSDVVPRQNHLEVIKVATCRGC